MVEYTFVCKSFSATPQMEKNTDKRERSNNAKEKNDLQRLYLIVLESPTSSGQRLCWSRDKKYNIHNTIIGPTWSTIHQIKSNFTRNQQNYKMS